MRNGSHLNKKIMEKENLTIVDKKGVHQPAWTHEDGTVVSHWDSLPMLLIEDEDGVQEITHELAKELGYES